MYSVCKNIKVFKLFEELLIDIWLLVTPCSHKQIKNVI